MVKSEIFRIQKTNFSEIRVDISGHGIGGAIGHFLALHVRRLHFKSVHNIRLVTFGSPMVGDAGFKNAFELAVGRSQQEFTVAERLEAIC